MRKLFALPILILVLASGCFSSEAPDAADRKTVTEAITKLSDPDQAVRDDTAKLIRETLARNPAASSDPGEAYWTEKLKAIKPGMTEDEIHKILGGTLTMGHSGGGGTTRGYQLDDYWSMALYLKTDDKTLMSASAPCQDYRRFWVEPPKQFTGHWITYFVNGQVTHDIEYLNGKYIQSKSYYSNGQITSMYNQAEDLVIGYYSDGTKQSEGRYIEGKQDGVWKSWHANGNKQSESHYKNGIHCGINTNWYENGKKFCETHYDDDGKCTGDAGWNKDGTLAFARGTTADAKDDK